MANVKNFGAEIVGKAIVIGQTTSKYVVVSVDGDNVQTMFYRTEGDTPVPVPITAQALSKMLASGKLHIEGATTVAAPEETVSDNTEETAIEDAVEEVSAEDVDQEQEPTPNPNQRRNLRQRRRSNLNPNLNPNLRAHLRAHLRALPRADSTSMASTRLNETRPPRRLWVSTRTITSIKTPPLSVVLRVASMSRSMAGR